MAIAIAACDFPTPGGPTRRTFWCSAMNRGGGEFAEPGAGNVRIERPVEIGELFDLSNGCLFESAFEQAVGASLFRRAVFR